MLETATAVDACVTVNWADPDDALKLPSPAQLAPTPVKYVPTAIPARLALLSVATPLASVDSLPTVVPLRENETDLPATGFPPEVSVADRSVLPP